MQCLVLLRQFPWLAGERLNSSGNEAVTLVHFIPAQTSLYPENQKILWQSQSHHAPCLVIPPKKLNSAPSLATFTFSTNKAAINFKQLKRHTMDHYDPSKKINSEQWLSIDEGARQQLVEEFHESLDDNPAQSSLKAHSAMHVTVENQLAGGEAPKVNQTLTKLMQQGLDRHEAIHAIAAVLGKELFSMMQKNSSEFSLKNYSRKLEKLTAKRWEKGVY